MSVDEFPTTAPHLTDPNNNPPHTTKTSQTSSNFRNGDPSNRGAITNNKNKQQQQQRNQKKQQQQYFTLAGKAQPLHTALRIEQQQVALIWRSIVHTVHVEDLVLLAAVGWLTVPLLQTCYEFLSSSFFVLLNTNDADADADKSGKKSGSRKRYYRDTVYFQIADHLQQVTKIALAVYCVDIFKLIAMGLMGMHDNGDGAVGGGTTTTATAITSTEAAAANFPHAFGQVVYCVWAANRGAALKRLLLRKYVSDHPETFGRVKILNRLADAVIYGMTFSIILNILQVQMGVAMQSFLAFGSIGTLAVGLASQGIAKEVLNGLMLASSDRLYEGDDVLFGTTGLSGSIVKLGWMETIIRGSDEISVSIPNTDLVKERVSNLSRVRLSQVKQVLRLNYEDADKIPVLIDRIKYELQLSCPELITDGSRPFRVHWTAMNNDHCELTVDTRHRIKPTGDAYLENKQNALTAIHRALKRHNCKLVESSPIVLK